MPISALMGTINYKMLFEEVLKLAPETIKSLQTVCWGIKSSELISLMSDRFWNRCSRLLLAITTLKLHPLFILSFIWMQYLSASVHVFIDAVISQSFFKKAKCQQMCTEFNSVGPAQLLSYYYYKILFSRSAQMISFAFSVYLNFSTSVFYFSFFIPFFLSFSPWLYFSLVCLH